MIRKRKKAGPERKGVNEVNLKNYNQNVSVILQVDCVTARA